MQTFKAIVEIPAGSPNKYEINPENNNLKLDFVYHDGLTCPFNYGSALGTLAKDGDPVDVIILSSFPIHPKTEVEIKPIGVLKLKDNGQQDNKVIAVASVDFFASRINDISDLTDEQKNQMVNFFKTVHEQKGKTTEIEGFFGKDQAQAEIEQNNAAN